MKRFFAMMLALVLALSLAACGASGGGVADPSDTGKTSESTEKAEAGSEPTEEGASSEEEAEPEETEVKWDMNEELDFEFEDAGGTVLLDTEQFHAYFSRLRMRDVENKNTGTKERCIFPSVIVVNNTDSAVIADATFAYAGNHDAESSYQIEPNESMGVGPRFPVDLWNGLVGETENCLLSFVKIELIKYDEEAMTNEVLEVFSFDLYASQTAPVKNVRVGAEAVAESELAHLVKTAGEPLYHAENEVISFDIIRTSPDNRDFTYIAENKTDYTIYIAAESNISNNGWSRPVAGEAYRAIGPKESWCGTVDEIYGGGRCCLKVFNAVGQDAVQLAFICDSYGEEKDASEVKFEEVCNIGSLKAAAFSPLAESRPVYSVENTAVRLDILGGYIEEDRTWNDTSFEMYAPIGVAVYALTNLSDQTLYLDDHDQTEIVPGETVYKKNSFASGEGRQESNSPISASFFANEAREDRAVEMFVRADWTYDTETGEVGASNFNAVTNSVKEEAMTGIYYSFYCDVEIASNEYYSLRLTHMSRTEDGRAVAELEMVNTSGSRYLFFDPGKQFSGYDPGADWFDPEETRFIKVEFTVSEPDLTSGPQSLNLAGYSWNGSTASKLFENTVNFTLRFDKHDPVVSAEVQG